MQFDISNHEETSTDESLPHLKSTRIWPIIVYPETGMHGNGHAGDIDSFSRVAVKTSDGFAILDPRNIVWIQSSGNWLVIHSELTDHRCRMTMTDFELSVNPRSFIRIHRNAIVNLLHVSEFSMPRYGNAFARLCSGKDLPVSRSGRVAIRKYLDGQIS